MESKVVTALNAFLVAIVAVLMTAFLVVSTSRASVVDVRDVEDLVDENRRRITAVERSISSIDAKLALILEELRTPPLSAR